MILGPAPWINDRDHPQVLIALPNNEVIPVDEGIAEFMSWIVRELPPHGRTDFSCQGHPGKRIVSAYVVISSLDPDWISNLTKHMCVGLQTFLPYPIRIVPRGHWPDYHSRCRRGSRVFIEQDSIRGDVLGSPSMCHEIHHRMVLRWRPEDFEPVRLGVMEGLFNFTTLDWPRQNVA